MTSQSPTALCPTKVPSGIRTVIVWTSWGNMETGVTVRYVEVGTCFYFTSGYLSIRGSSPSFLLFCSSAGGQLVPLEGPRDFHWVCRDENQAGQLQKFWEQKKTFVDLWGSLCAHLISAPTASHLEPPRLSQASRSSRRHWDTHETDRKSLSENTTPKNQFLVSHWVWEHLLGPNGCVDMRITVQLCKWIR